MKQGAPACACIACNPESGLALRTQPRQAGQRASRDRLGATVQPCTSSSHSNTWHRKHRICSMRPLRAELRSCQSGGYRYIRMYRLLGLWEVPPRKIPPSPRIRGVTGEMKGYLGVYGLGSVDRACSGIIAGSAWRCSAMEAGAYPRFRAPMPRQPHGPTWLHGVPMVPGAPG